MGIAAFVSPSRTDAGYVLRRSGEGVSIRYEYGRDQLIVTLPTGTTYTLDNSEPQGFPFAEPSTYIESYATASFEMRIEVPEIDGVKLSYLRQAWIYDDLSPFFNPDDADGEIFHFGFRTANSAMPRSGTATYLMDLRGHIATPTARAYILTRSGAQFSADFGSGQVNLSITAQGAQSADSTKTVDLGTWSGTGAIASVGSLFGGALGGSGGADGEFVGTFYGPGAGEVGVSFYVEQGAYYGTGVIVGRKD